jgi:hypothetical protein
MTTWEPVHIMNQQPAPCPLRNWPRRACRALRRHTGSVFARRDVQDGHTVCDAGARTLSFYQSIFGPVPTGLVARTRSHP